MSYPNHVDIETVNQLIQDIDFLEIELVRKIEIWNENSFSDDELNNRLATFWMADDGLSSIEAFEDVIRYFHSLLKE